MSFGMRRDLSCACGYVHVPDYGYVYACGYVYTHVYGNIDMCVHVQAYVYMCVYGNVTGHM